MPNAARVGDLVKQASPHCHAPIHPPAPVPTPVPHSPLPLPIVVGVPNVLIGGQPAAIVGSVTTPCLLGPCVPGGPGLVVDGSKKVKIYGLPAARVGDKTAHLTCVAPIPSPLGKIQAPGCPTVKID